VTRGRSLALGAFDTVEGGEVRVGRRRQGHQALHQRRCGQGEGTAPLRRVLVPPVLEATQPAVRDGPAGARAAESVQSLSSMRRSFGVKVHRHIKLDSTSARNRSATLPFALLVGSLSRVHVGVQTGWVLPSVMRALMLETRLAVAQTGRVVVSRLFAGALMRP
jgi:hypothetical protein